jgi:hypothetical protein
MPIGRTKDLHDAGQLFLLVLTREDRISSPQLGENAAQTPHVNPEAIAAAQNDFRAAVEARLDIRVYLFFLATRGAKVNDANVSFASLTQEDILRLEIAMNDALLLKENQTGEELTGEAADEWKREADEVVSADELVEVDREAGRNNAKMGAEVEGGGDAEGSKCTIRVL